MTNWRYALSVMFFGFWGGILRYFFGVWFQFNGTIMVNLIGCFSLAFLTYFFLAYKKVSGWFTIGLGMGLVGSFTTFSTFNLDLLKLALAHQNTYLIFYLLLSVFGGLALSFCGYWFGTKTGKRFSQEVMA